MITIQWKNINDQNIYKLEKKDQSWPKRGQEDFRKQEPSELGFAEVEA